MIDIEQYLSTYTRSDYQRDNFDAFLSKIGFKYCVPSIHIAGTNGKGSTAAYLNEIYVENGYKTGIFSTPDDFFETIKINNQSIDNEFIEGVIHDFEKYFKKFDLSGFEIQTFIALKYFQDNKVDIAIIECGMGGELDATNVFDPILSIITSVSIEHSAFLGDSLSSIAAHKAGIIRNGAPALIGKATGDALEVVVEKCKYEKSKLIMVDQYHNYHLGPQGASFDYRPYSDLKITSKAEYSAFAACLAVEATNILSEMFQVREDAIKFGLLKMKLKCRFEVIFTDPLIVLDGAHNPEAIEQLRKEIDAVYPDKRFQIVFASFKDKSVANMLPEINLVGDIHLTTFHHPRARTIDDYFIYLEDYEFVENYRDLIEKIKTSGEPMLITGSLAFVYEAKQYLEGK